MLYLIMARPPCSHSSRYANEMLAIQQIAINPDLFAIISPWVVVLRLALQRHHLGELSLPAQPQPLTARQSHSHTPPKPFIQPHPQPFSQLVHSKRIESSAVTHAAFLKIMDAQKTSS